MTFVSDLYPGSISDKQITKQSGLIDLCEEGDAIMADKGFFNFGSIDTQGRGTYYPPLQEKETSVFTP